MMSAYRYYRPRHGGRATTGQKAAAAAVAAVVLAGASHGVTGVIHDAAGSAALTPGQVSTGSNVVLGEDLAGAYGWGSGQEWDCLDWLWTRESGWRIVWNAQGSGAYGIPQALPADKMAAAGPDWQTNPATEIRWGLGYIKGTYGSPCNAWGHETAAGWY